MNPFEPCNRYCGYPYRALAASTARHILRQREDGYPRLITEGRMTAPDAARKLELSRVLVAQWSWIVDPSRPPLPAFDDTTASYFGAMDEELRPELASIAADARRRAERDPSDARLEKLAQLCEALYWLQLAQLCEALYWLQLGDRDSGMRGPAFVVQRTETMRRAALAAATNPENHREAA